ncbi:hypothetical protein D3C81_2127780 [compost metagenome]
MKACSEASSSAPSPPPATSSTITNPVCRPKIVVVVLRRPYDRPWLIDSTAPDPGDTAITQHAAK